MRGKVWAQVRHSRSGAEGEAGMWARGEGAAGGARRSNLSRIEKASGLLVVSEFADFDVNTCWLMVLVECSRVAEVGWALDLLLFLLFAAAAGFELARGFCFSLDRVEAGVGLAAHLVEVDG